MAKNGAKSGLTSAMVETIRPEAQRVEIGDGLLPGLYLVIQPTGRRSWALRYRFDGKPAKLTLGTAIAKREATEGQSEPTIGSAMTLAEARRAARAAIAAIQEGVDPAAGLRLKKQAAKVEPVDPDRDFVRLQSANFIERYAKPRLRAWKEIERQFKSEIVPVWGERNVQDIAKRDVLDLLDAITDRGSPVTANRIYATLRRFFEWLVERDVLTSSPMTGVRKPTQEEARERVLSDHELRLVWQAADSLSHPFAPMVKLLVLTGQRRGEVAGMAFAEIEGKTWIIPKGRTKNGIEHAVPLSASALEVINGLPRIGHAGLAFTTTGETRVSGFTRAKTRLDVAMLSIMQKDDPEAVLTPWTLHDLRRTMASGMARLNIPLPVIEKCLNHASGSFAGIVSVYQKHDYLEEKRRAFEIWAGHVERMASGEAANVIPMKRGA